MSRELPSIDRQRAALAEARARVRTAERQGETELHIQDLEDLTAFPANISTFNGVRSIYASKTLISDLSVLRPLRRLHYLDVSHTLVSDLTPVRELHSLEFLYINDTLVSDLNQLKGLQNLILLEFDGTAISDLNPVSSLRRLRYLSFARTRVRDLSPISANTDIHELDMSFTDITDLSSIRDLSKISTLSLNGTKVSSLAPLAGMDRLLTPSLIGGAKFSSCPNLPDELQEISNLRMPSRTLRLRRYFGEIDLDEPEDDDVVWDTDLEQRPSSHSFEWRDEILVAVPRQTGSFAPAIAEQIISEFRRKLSSLCSMLGGNQVNPELSRVSEDIIDELSDGVDSVREGVLLMKVRSLQAIIFVYVESVADQEPLLASKAADISLSCEDLLSVFEGLRVIDANRQALNFQANEASLDAFLHLSGQIISAAASSPVVSKGALDALQLGSDEIDKLNLVLALSGSDKVRAMAIEKRASIASLQALEVRNFSAAPLKRIFDQFGGLASDSWKEARAAIPKGVGIGVQGVVSGAIKTGAAGLVSLIAGPLGGLAMLISSFAPLAKAAATQSAVTVNPSETEEVRPLDGE